MSTPQERIARLQRIEGEMLFRLDKAAAVYERSLHVTRFTAMSMAIERDPDTYNAAIAYGEQWRKLALQTGAGCWK